MTQMNINISVNIVHKANNVFVTFQQKNLNLLLYIYILRLRDIMIVGSFQAKEATMYEKSSPGETKKRDLHQDDLNGFFAIYG